MALHIAYPLFGRLHQSVCKRWLLEPTRTKSLPNGLVVVGLDSPGKKTPCAACRTALPRWMRVKFIEDFSGKELDAMAKRILAAHAKVVA